MLRRPIRPETIIGQRMAPGVELIAFGRCWPVEITNNPPIRCSPAGAEVFADNFPDRLHLFAKRPLGDVGRQGHKSPMPIVDPRKKWLGSDSLVPHIEIRRGRRLYTHNKSDCHTIKSWASLPNLYCRTGGFGVGQLHLKDLHCRRWPAGPYNCLLL